MWLYLAQVRTLLNFNFFSPYNTKLRRFIYQLKTKKTLLSTFHFSRLIVILLFSSLWVPSSMPLSSLFYTWPSSSLASFLARLTHSLSFKCCNCANALTLSFRCCYCVDALTLFFRCCCYGLSSCYEFVFYFYPKPPIFFFFFFSCFCFSHPKHWNPNELNWNRMQSVGPVFFPYKLVLALNMLKPKFSARCKNYLQHRLTWTDYTPTCCQIVQSLIILGLKKIWVVTKFF